MKNFSSQLSFNSTFKMWRAGRMDQISEEDRKAADRYTQELYGNVIF